MTDQSDRQGGDGLKATCELPLRQQIAYEAFRGGFRDSTCPVPPWDDAPPWVRDIATICYLQGTLDRPRVQQRNMVVALPCPFCGSRASASIYSPDMLFKVECTGCTAKVSGFDQCQQDAIDAWNTRADSHAELVKALEEIASWRKDTLGVRPRAEGYVTERDADFDRGVRMAFYRCADRASAALATLTARKVG